MTAIDVYGDQPFDTTGTSPDIRAVPDQIAQADRHMRAIARLETLAGEVRTAFATEIGRLEARLDEQIERIQRDIQWHKQPLVQLHAAILADNPKRKTLVLPAGTVRSRTSHTPKLRLFDSEAALNWAADNDRGMLRVTYRFDLVAAAAKLRPVGELSPGDTSPAVTEGGEIVPGVEFVLPGTSFVVEPDGVFHEIDQAKEG